MKCQLAFPSHTYQGFISQAFKYLHTKQHIVLVRRDKNPYYLAMPRQLTMALLSFKFSLSKLAYRTLILDIRVFVCFVQKLFLNHIGTYYITISVHLLHNDENSFSTIVQIAKRRARIRNSTYVYAGLNPIDPNAIFRFIRRISLLGTTNETFPFSGRSHVEDVKKSKELKIS